MDDNNDQNNPTGGAAYQPPMPPGMPDNGVNNAGSNGQGGGDPYSFGQSQPAGPAQPLGPTPADMLMSPQAATPNQSQVQPQTPPTGPAGSAGPTPGQRSPLKIDDALLVELGLGALPVEERKALQKHIYETLEMRVGMRLADQMSNEQLDEFETFFNARDDAGAFRWLETNFPNYKDIVAEEFEKLKGEVGQSSAQIVAASQQQAAMPAGSGTSTGPAYDSLPSQPAWDQAAAYEQAGQFAQPNQNSNPDLNQSPPPFSAQPPMQTQVPQAYPPSGGQSPAAGYQQPSVQQSPPPSYDSTAQPPPANPDGPWQQ